MERAMHCEATLAMLIHPAPWPCPSLTHDPFLTHARFDRFIMLMIVFNTVTLAMEHTKEGCVKYASDESMFEWLTYPPELAQRLPSSPPEPSPTPQV